MLCMTSSVLGNGRACLCLIWETHCFVMQKQSSGKKNTHPSSVSPSAFRLLSGLFVAVSQLAMSPPATPALYLPQCLGSIMYYKCSGEYLHWFNIKSQPKPKAMNPKESFPLSQLNQRRTLSYNFVPDMNKSCLGKQ